VRHTLVQELEPGAAGHVADASKGKARAHAVHHYEYLETLLWQLRCYYPNFQHHCSMARDPTREELLRLADGYPSGRPRPVLHACSWAVCLAPETVSTSEEVVVAIYTPSPKHTSLR
jgi:hypothetical protein